MAGPRTGAPMLITFAVANVAALTVIGVGGIATGFIQMGDVNAGRASAAWLSATTPTATVPASATQAPVETTPTPAPTRNPVPIDPQAVVIRLSDLRTGYTLSIQSRTSLCNPCRVLSSWHVEFWNADLQRLISSEVNLAGTLDQAMANLQAMETGFPAGVSVAGLGDQSYAATGPVLTYDGFFVIWRSGVLTQRLEITAPPGTLSLQSAIDLARVQEARAQAAIAAAS